MNLSTEYPLWFIIFCLLLGGVYAAILYYKNRKSGYTVTIDSILAVFRFLVVSFIAFLLLNPLIKNTSYYTEKPVIVIGVDNSSSIAIGKDSLFYLTEFTKSLDNLETGLKDRYDVKTYTFGEKIRPGLSLDYNEKQTDISAFLEEISNIYTYRNTGALIIATDGLYNRGMNPVYAASGLTMPVFAVALGDTSVQRDLLIRRINYNRISFVGNEFPLEIMVEAHKSEGLSTRLTVSKNDEILYNQTVEITRSDFLTKHLVYLKANEPGVQRYSIRLSPVSNEITLVNNALDIFIDMLEGKQKILVLANAPHPDISVIKQAVLSNANFEIEDFVITDFDKPVVGYDLVILHGLPSLKNSVNFLLETLKNERTPVLFIVTQNTSLPLFNEQLAGVSVQPQNILYNEALPRLNALFSNFSLSDQTYTLIESAPPLISPYGTIKMQAAVSALLFQRIGSVNTSDPQWMFYESPEKKFGVILGEGIWRWRLKSFSLTGSHEPFDELINKTVQYLSLKVDKRFFRVINANNFDEIEDIEFEAQVYNEIYELINEPEVKLNIRDQSGKEFPFVFSRTANAYFLNAGKMEPGAYTYEAVVNLGDKLFTEKGEFTVARLNLELSNTTADHNLLFNLAESKGGVLVYPSQMNDLVKIIRDRDDIKSITYFQKTFSEILNNIWILIALLILISAEWFIRKRAGGY